MDKNDTNRYDIDCDSFLRKNVDVVLVQEHGWNIQALTFIFSFRFDQICSKTKITYHSIL